MLRPTKFFLVLLAFCITFSGTAYAAPDTKTLFEVVTLYQLISNASLSTSKTTREELLEKIEKAKVNTEEGKKIKEKVLEALEKEDKYYDILSYLEKQTEQFGDGQQQIKDLYGALLEPDADVEELLKKEFSWETAFPELKDIKEFTSKLTSAVSNWFGKLSKLLED